MPKTLLALTFAIACAAAARAEFPTGKIVDLTHAFDATTIFWPTEKGFILEKEHAGKTDKGYYYAANRFCTAEHGGTHIDAPVHFGEGKRTVDELALEALIGPAIVVDVSKQATRNRDYRIRIEDFEDWERTHGEIPKEAIVLLRTGYGKFWPKRKAYLGTEERGSEAVSKLHFPGLDPEAARWLVEKRNISAVGIDTASIDHGQSTEFETHRVLSSHNVPSFENVANLDQLPDEDVTVIALPMKIRGGSGGPLRIVAVIQEI